MLENTMMGMVGICLAVMAVVDRRNKEIPILPCVICLVCVVVGQIVNRTPWQTWLPGILVGVGLYVVSKGSRGAIGEGDALVYVLLGSFLGLIKTIELLLLSLFICSLFSIGLLFFRHVGRNYRIAFVPFTAIAYGLVMLV